MSEEKSSLIQVIRLWKIDKDILHEIKKTKLDLEERLEEWITSDVSIISDEFLVIGRQVETSFGGVIDLLCIEGNGDLVIIELKRDKTPRKITAQVLDYASWLQDLTAEQIENIAEEYLKDSSFEDAFNRKFKHDLPESLNEEHKMLVVGSEIDSSSQRIINYLSEKGVSINAITFNYFQDDQSKFLARTFLIKPSKAGQIKRPSKRRPNLTEEQLQEISNEKGVGEIYRELADGLSTFFNQKSTTQSSLAFKGLQDGKMPTIFSIIPVESKAEDGLKFQVYLKRFLKLFNITEERAESILPENKEEYEYVRDDPDLSGYEGFFKNIEEAKGFLIELQRNYKSLPN